MRILDDLISSIKEDALVKGIYCCAHFTAVISRDCGLASTLVPAHSHHQKVRGVGNLTGGSALRLAEYAKSDNPLEASIGMATINSLIEVDESKCTTQNAFEILAKQGQGKRIAIVGHFPGIPRLRQVARELWVLEQHPRPGDLPSEMAGEILPQADVVGISGTTLTNHTLETLLELSRGKFIVLIGPTSPLSPVLFDHGISVVGGVKVVDPEKVIRTISEGATYPQIQGLRKLCLIRD
ncbi:MAG: hypothetical protein DRI26_04375 [Chloroflexi bacterium]|nr:MAG: hypothetical protein DRI26_04375 [Chloroflexota bacterium]